jgi:tRNA (cytidine/uridine-2'-O-)-methyltransferase
MRLALFEPDIPQNAGTLIRAAACLGIGIDLIGPCGFTLDDRRFRRAGLDYIDKAVIVAHQSWDAFRAARVSRPGRLLLLTRHGEAPYTEFRYLADDVLMVGRESGGVPDAVGRVADARLRIPIRTDTRSLNVAVAAAMVLGEALRQTGGFPRPGRADERGDS